MSPDSKPILTITNVVKRFGGFHALDGLTFHVTPGEILGLVGPNGSGKTTAINVISGLYAPDGNPIISLFAEEGIRALARSLPVVIKDPKNLDRFASGFAGLPGHANRGRRRSSQRAFVDGGELCLRRRVSRLRIDLFIHRRVVVLGPRGDEAAREVPFVGCAPTRRDDDAGDERDDHDREQWQGPPPAPLSLPVVGALAHACDRLLETVTAWCTTQNGRT